MSYDLWADCPCGCPNCNFEYVNWNYTSNMAPAWREAGVDLAEYHGKTCGELADALGPAIQKMQQNEADYARRFNSPNGWGKMSNLIPALERLRIDCNQRRDARLGVSR